MTRLDIVPRFDVETVWPHIEWFVLRACEVSRGELNPDVIRQKAGAGTIWIWVASIDGTPVAVALVSIEDWDVTTARVVALAADDTRRWRAFEAELENQLKAHGVKRMVQQGRRGWLRALKGWTAMQIVMEKAL